MVRVVAVPINPAMAPDLGGTERFSRTIAGYNLILGVGVVHGGAVERRGPDDGMLVRRLRAVVDKLITSMDTTSPVHWSWSSPYFQTAGKHLLAIVVTASYGFQFGSSTTPWKDHQVYFDTDPASCGYLIRVGHKH
jgi:hypothetical protein